MLQVNAALGLIKYDTFDVLSYPLMANPEDVDFADKDGDGVPDEREGGGNKEEPKKENVSEEVKHDKKDEADKVGAKNQLAVAS